MAQPRAELGERVAKANFWLTLAEDGVPLSSIVPDRDGVACCDRITQTLIRLYFAERKAGWDEEASVSRIKATATVACSEICVDFETRPRAAYAWMTGQIDPQEVYPPEPTVEPETT